MTPGRSWFGVRLQRWPRSGVEVRILDENRCEVRRGEIGRIFARTTNQFEACTFGQTTDVQDGFMASGDLAYVDEAGRLFVVGRDDEVIISGGENVYPIEVEKTARRPPRRGGGVRHRRR